MLRRYHIGFSIAIAKQYFWDACEGFSLAFAILMTQAGQDFVAECREAGKEICVWTVNHPDEMRMAMQWGVKAVLTDKVGAFVQLRDEVRCYFITMFRTRRSTVAARDMDDGISATLS